MVIPELVVPILQIPIAGDIQLYLKREDLIHPEVSGNKYWKLFYNVNDYLSKQVSDPRIITFGGAYSNHIAAVAALGNLCGIPTLGIIRGEELASRWQENLTLKKAAENRMAFRFVSREDYRDKELLAKQLEQDYPHALHLPEGGTGPRAVEGIRHMLDTRTAEFDYLCCAAGTGGTVAGIAKFCQQRQKVVGFPVVGDRSLKNRIYDLSHGAEFNLVDAAYGGYGTISNELVRFINEFYRQHHIPLDPVYTGKMMMRLMELIREGFFESGAKILAFHTGGLQGIEGANQYLKRKNRELINF